MPSPVSPTRRRQPVSLAGIAFLAVVTALGVGFSRAQAAGAAASSEAGTETVESSTAESSTAESPGFVVESDPFADRFPNVVLKTHEGRNVRFYDDLLKDKIVLINFMYATCTER